MAVRKMVPYMQCLLACACVRVRKTLTVSVLRIMMNFAIRCIILPKGTTKRPAFKPQWLSVEGVMRVN